MSDFHFEKKVFADPVTKKERTTTIEDVIIGKGVIGRLPELIRNYGSDHAFPFVVSDVNTEKAAGENVSRILSDNGFSFAKYVFPTSPKPDNRGVGDVLLHFDDRADFLIGVGSGVINDIMKIVSTVRRCPYVIVATAPSMDGYASETSSMIRDGLKFSVPCKGPTVILGDVDILKDAPLRMMKSGLGDMIAKYVSITEWRISHIINGEPFSEEIAEMIRSAVKKCVDNREGLLRRDEEAVQAVFEGLVIGGVAMAYAGCSRPASGGEHYMSHIIDMRSLEFGTPEDFHGIQCGIMTLYMARIYEQVAKAAPDRARALAFVRSFDKERWNAVLRELLGRSAEPMIELEKREGKYDLSKHEARLETILEKWDEIVSVIKEEMASPETVEEILDTIDAPKSLHEIGIDDSMEKILFEASKDIRDKYVLSRLVWDLGLIDQIRFETH